MLGTRERPIAYWVRIDFADWPQNREVEWVTSPAGRTELTWLDQRKSTPITVTAVEGAGVLLRHIAADGLTVDLAAARRLDRWALVGDTSWRIDQTGGFVLPGAVNQIVMELEPGTGAAVIQTYAGNFTITAGSALSTHDIECAPPPGCWILVEDSNAGEVALRLSSSAAERLQACTITRFDGTETRLHVPDALVQRIDPTGMMQLKWEVPILAEESRIHSSWLLVLSGGAVGLVGLWWIGRRTPCFPAEAIGVPAQLSGGWAAAGLNILLLVHLLWALTMPVVPTNDSVEYYAMGRRIAAGEGLAAVGAYRTPGYPGLIAATLLAFGDNLLGIVLIQHAAMVGLACLVHRLLVGRNPRLALTAAAVTGFAPLTSLCANAIWTETVYTICTCGALALYLLGSRSPRQFVLMGLLIGAATLVRPTGWWLALVLCIAEATQLFRAPVAKREVLVRLGSLVSTTALCIAPWVAVYYVREGSLGMSKAQGMTLWANSVLQGRANASDAPYNRPIRLLFTAPFSSVYGGRDPFLLRQVAEEQGFVLDPVFFQHVFSTAEAAPERIFADRLATFAYNFTFRREVVPGRMMLFPELDWLVSLARQKSTEVESITQETLPYPTLIALTQGTLPNASGLVAAFCSFVEALGLAIWPYVVAVALLYATWALTGEAQLRALAVLGWIGFVFAGPVFIGMPAQRYVMVIEPLVLLLCVLAAWAVPPLIWRRLVRMRHRPTDCGSRYEGKA